MIKVEAHFRGLNQQGRSVSDVINKGLAAERKPLPIADGTCRNRTSHD
jgi:hypothetical protein